MAYNNVMVWIGIMVSIVSVCAVFVTITPIINRKTKRDLEKAIENLEKKTEFHFGSERTNIHSVLEKYFLQVSNFQNENIDKMYYHILSAYVQNYNKRQQKKLYYPTPYLTQFKLDSNEIDNNKEKIASIYQMVNGFLTHTEEEKKKIKEELKDLIGEEPSNIPAGGLTVSDIIACSKFGNKKD